MSPRHTRNSRPTRTFNGYAAFVTPFNPNGSVDWHAFSRYLEFHQKNGTKRGVVGGTTSQFSALSPEKRMQLLRTARVHFKGELVFNISSCALQDILKYYNEALHFANGVILLPPFYDKGMSEEELYNFLRTVLKSTSLMGVTNIYLYNFPRHTGLTITPQMLKRLSEEFPIAGIKDSSGDFASALGYQKECPEVPVLMGNDFDFFKALPYGMGGFISGGTAVFPPLLAKIEAAAVSGDLKKAEALQVFVNGWCTKLGEWCKRFGCNEKAILAVALGAANIGFPHYVSDHFLPVAEEHHDEIHRFYLHIAEQVAAA